MYQKPPHTIKTDSLLKFAAYASTVTAVLLLTVKCFAWFSTGSLTVLASLVDSLMDGAASLINLLAIRYSQKSADHDHQFGHGKAESLAGLGQACFIAGSAIFLAIHAIERLTTPQPLERTGVGIAVMLFAIIATLILLAIQGHVIRKTNSTAIKADSLHYKTDLLTNISTVAVLFFASSDLPLLDPLCALAIAGYILFSAWQIGHEAAQILMDRELPESVRQTIADIALGHPAVVNVHDIRTRQSGQLLVIQFHLRMDGNLPLLEAHHIAKTVEQQILSTFPNADVIIHQDPASSEQQASMSPE